MMPCRDIDYVLHKLDWMREEGIWPNGLRYLWTDAFGVVLLASLAVELKDLRYLDQAGQLVVEQINRFFDTWHSGDEYDREAITHVMACTSHFPGLMLPERA